MLVLLQIFYTTLTFFYLQMLLIIKKFAFSFWGIINPVTA